MAWFIISLLALAAAALVVYAARARGPGSTRPRTSRGSRATRKGTSRVVSRGEATPRGGPFEAVSIVPGLVPCPAARELRGHRFLIGSGPTLPLADCTSKNCTCRIRQHPDRRNEGDHGDRRLGIGLQSEIHEAEGRPERRRRRGRRKGDPAIPR